jgi:hypothetical protein
LRRGRSSSSPFSLPASAAPSCHPIHCPNKHRREEDILDGKGVTVMNLALPPPVGVPSVPLPILAPALAETPPQPGIHSRLPCRATPRPVTCRVRRYGKKTLAHRPFVCALLLVVPSGDVTVAPAAFSSRFCCIRSPAYIADAAQRECLSLSQ